jgi:hypothetical protein
VKLTRADQGKDLNLFLKEEFEFQSDGTFTISGQSFATDQSCQNSISEAETLRIFHFDESPKDTKHIYSYKVSSQSNNTGIYDFDLIYGTSPDSPALYTSIQLHIDHLTISDVCSGDDNYCKETGRTQELRAQFFGPSNRHPMFYLNRIK